MAAEAAEPAPPQAYAASGQLDVPAVLGLWHLLSLDAPTVAVVWSLGFAWASRVRLTAWLLALLALATWSVYVADRLLDARGAFGSGRIDRLQPRHLFHWRHRRAFVPLALAVSCAVAWLLFRVLPPIVLKRDSVLAAAALAYFSVVHARHGLAELLPPSPIRLPSKELLVGVLFTAGCVLPSWGRAAPQGSIPWMVCGEAAYFAALAWFNCRAIAHWESSLLRCRTFSRAILLGVAGLLLAGAFGPLEPRSAALVLAGAWSALLLALLDWQRRRLTPLALRVAADLVLLTPLLLLPIGGLAR